MSLVLVGILIWAVGVVGIVLVCKWIASRLD